MSSTTDASAGRAQITARTLRTDRWWLSPLLTAAGLVALGHLRDRARVHAEAGTSSPEYHYLTPFYSPCVSMGCVPEAAHFGRFLPDLPVAALAAAHAAVPAAVPADLLLLPQGLLPVASGCRRRPARSPSRTGATPARPGSR